MKKETKQKIALDVGNQITFSFRIPKGFQGGNVSLQIPLGIEGDGLNMAVPNNFSSEGDNRHSYGISVSGRPIHGTGELIETISIIPEIKSEKEVFWTNELVCRLPDFSNKKFHIYSNPDDSSGNHDVIIDIQGEEKIGVQVTEFTNELQKARSNQRDHYLEKIIIALKNHNVSAQERVAVKIFFSRIDFMKKIKFPSPDDIAKHIAFKIEQSNIFDKETENTDFGRLIFFPVGTADFYTPHFNNIGIDVNFDELPRTFEMYATAIDYIVQKKQASKSPWLLIWSDSFYRDKHWLMDEILNYMINSFKETEFSSVYFIESQDGDGSFQANISIHKIL